MGQGSRRYETLAARVRLDFPRFRVIRRSDSWWMRLIFRFLSLFLRGQGYGNYTTTIGSTIYVPDNWFELSDHQRYMTLRHELMHIRQFHRWPLGRYLWPVNYLLMGLTYLLLPLPVFFTARAHFERQGYLQTMLVLHELNGRLSDEQMEREAAHLADIFGGPAYAWMWTKKKAYEWAMETMRRINEGYIKNEEDRIPG